MEVARRFLRATSAYHLIVDPDDGTMTHRGGWTLLAFFAVTVAVMAAVAKGMNQTFR